MKRGFSLIEVMMASVLFLITLAGVFSAFSTSANMFAHYENETSAMHIGESVMEELILRGRSDPLLIDGTTTSVVFDEDGQVVAGGKFTATWTIVGATPLAGLRTINLAVTWNESGTPRTLKLMTVRE